MKLEECLSIIDTMKKGTITDIEYRTKVDSVNKEIVLEKLTKTVGRIGCNYNNLKLTKENRDNGQGVSTKKNNNVWIREDFVKYNTNTKNYLVCLDRMENQKFDNKFFKTENGQTVEIEQVEFEQLKKPKNFSKFVNPIWTINVENIVSLKKSIK